MISEDLSVGQNGKRYQLACQLEPAWNALWCRAESNSQIYGRV